MSYPGGPGGGYPPPQQNHQGYPPPPQHHQQNSNAPYGQGYPPASQHSQQMGSYYPPGSSGPPGSSAPYSQPGPAHLGASGYPPSHGSAAPLGGGPGPHGQQASFYGNPWTQPPPNSDPRLWEFFNGVDLDKSGQIDVKELHQALRNGDWQPYGLDTLSILMNMFDVDRSGTIGFNEFTHLWK
jgi:peflin